MKVTKEFWVSDNCLKRMVENNELSVVLRCKDESKLEGLLDKAVHKITISYEIDREVTIKESDIDKLFSNNSRYTYRDIEIIKQKLFGGGENEWDNKRASRETAIRN